MCASPHLPRISSPLFGGYSVWGLAHLPRISSSRHSVPQFAKDRGTAMISGHSVHRVHSLRTIHTTNNTFWLPTGASFWKLDVTLTKPPPTCAWCDPSGSDVEDGCLDSHCTSHLDGNSQAPSWGVAFGCCTGGGGSLNDTDWTCMSTLPKKCEHASDIRKGEHCQTVTTSRGFATPRPSTSMGDFATPSVQPTLITYQPARALYVSVWALLSLFSTLAGNKRKAYEGRVHGHLY